MQTNSKTFEEKSQEIQEWIETAYLVNLIKKLEEEGGEKEYGTKAQSRTS